MKKEYYNRGKKIEVEQLTDTVAIKQELPLREQRMLLLLKKILEQEPKYLQILEMSLDYVSNKKYLKRLVMFLSNPMKIPVAY